MTLSNIKQRKNAGFTIVELLIVIVIIAILAAITIVAYNGVQNRAKASAAQAAANNLSKKWEAYNAEEGRYPLAITDLTGAATTKTYYSAASSLPTISGTADPTTAPADQATVALRKCAAAAAANQAAITATNVSGAQIVWWDFTKTTGQATTVNIGNTTSCPTS
jgi:prepilin-type N-terminal cleavage/methylation domain-containing protein